MKMIPTKRGRCFEKLNCSGVFGLVTLLLSMNYISREYEGEPEYCYVLDYLEFTF
jgi:hypothetical protein